MRWSRRQEPRGPSTLILFAIVVAALVPALALADYRPPVPGGPRPPMIEWPPAPPQELLDSLNAKANLDLSGGGDEGGETPVPDKERVKVVRFEYGHWTGHADWYKILNDVDPNYREYITNTRWEGKGTSGEPADHGIYHDFTNNWHVAYGRSADRDPRFENFNPLNEDPDPDAWPEFYDVGWGGTASYAWGQLKPAWLRYSREFNSASGWDMNQYSNLASYSETQTTTTLEYAAAGMIGNGATGFAEIRMLDRSSACGNGCDEYTDDTGWHWLPVDWA